MPRSARMRAPWDALDQRIVFLVAELEGEVPDAGRLLDVADVPERDLAVAGLAGAGLGAQRARGRLLGDHDVLGQPRRPLRQPEAVLVQPLQERDLLVRRDAQRAVDPERTRRRRRRRWCRRCRSRTASPGALRPAGRPSSRARGSTRAPSRDRRSAACDPAATLRATPSAPGRTSRRTRDRAPRRSRAGWRCSGS